MRMPDGTVRIKIEFRLKLGGRFRKEDGLLFFDKERLYVALLVLFWRYSDGFLEIFSEERGIGEIKHVADLLYGVLAGP